MSDHLDAIRKMRLNQTQHPLAVDSAVTIKKCPFCAEEILIDAIKCKHCGEIFANPSIDRLGYIHLININEFLELKIVIPKWYNLFGKTKYFINNQEVIPQKRQTVGKTHKQLLYEITPGKQVFIQAHTWGDPLPDIFIEDDKISSIGSLNWLQKIIVYAPILLVFRGGAIGALCGFTAITLNCKIIRLNSSVMKRGMLLLLSYCMLAIVYLIFAFVFLVFLHLIFGYKGTN